MSDEVFEEDVTFEEPAPLAPEAKAIVDHFKGEMPKFGPEDVEALAETPLAYKEVCEALLKELFTVTETRKKAEKYEKELKEEFKRLVGKDRGMIQRGAFGAKVLDTKGRETTDWERFVACVKEWAHHHQGDAGKKDVEKMLMDNKWPAVPGIAVTPYRVGAGDPEVD